MDPAYRRNTEGESSEEKKKGVGKGKKPKSRLGQRRPAYWTGPR